jgi:hypothetical protein
MKHKYNILPYKFEEIPNKIIYREKKIMDLDLLLVIIAVCIIVTIGMCCFVAIFIQACKNEQDEHQRLATTLV